MFLALRGGSENSKFSKFQIFPKLGTRGGRQISSFSQFKKSQIIPGEGGCQENCGLFPLFGTLFNSMAPLSYTKLLLDSSPRGGISP